MKNKNIYTEEFEVFWSLYPARGEGSFWHKDGKWQAQCEWQKLNREEKDKAMKVVETLKRGQFVLDACRWLKYKRFDDFGPIMPIKRNSKPSSAKSPEIKPIEPIKIASEEERRQIAKKFGWKI
jgi:hypothetical protein